MEPLKCIRWFSQYMDHQNLYTDYWGLIWNFLKTQRYHRNNVRTYETGGGLTLWRTLQLATRLTEVLEHHGVDVQQLGGRRPRCTKPCQAILMIYSFDYWFIRNTGTIWVLFWVLAVCNFGPSVQATLCHMNLLESSLFWIYQNFKAFGCLEVAHASNWNSPKPASSLTRSRASKWFNKRIPPKWSKMHSQYVVQHYWDDNTIHQAFLIIIYIDLLGLSTILRLLIKWGCSTGTWTILNPQSTLYTIPAYKTNRPVVTDTAFALQLISSYLKAAKWGWMRAVTRMFKVSNKK